MISSKFQTKQWRMNQSWYKTGKSTECERYQLSQLEPMLGYPLVKTHQRLDLFDFTLKEVKEPLTFADGFRWSENFDYISQNAYYNLKFICDVGGYQTRALREVYHFIYAQFCYLNLHQESDIYFINILDGDCCFKYMDKIRSLETGFPTQRRVFIGDMLAFATWRQGKLLNKKHQLGQFYTTQYRYILEGLKRPPLDVVVVEPFAGEGHLIEWLGADEYKTECYDIDPRRDWISQRDSFLEPPDYTDKFILTNPPYLARNKAPSKGLFDRYKVNDLYKCLVKELVSQSPRGGILILPLNFWCSNRKLDLELRRAFLDKFKVEKVRVFEEQVFEDTGYTTCAFSFTTSGTPTDTIEFWFDNGETIHLSLPDGKIAGDLDDLPVAPGYKIERLIERSAEATNIVVKCIDDSEKIGAKLTHDIFMDTTKNKSARSYMTLVIEPALSWDKQEKLVQQFNAFITQKRKETHSLFLTNYREKGRKRISFDLVYHIVGHLLIKLI